MTARCLIVGGPGSGKTERLLRAAEAALERGVPPQRVAFVSFTRAAVAEARARAKVKFGLTDDDLPLFRTLHSLAFRQLGLRRNEVMGEAAMAELSDVTGELVGEPSADPEEGPAAGRGADPLLTLDGYARATGRGLRGAWEDHGGKVGWWRLLRFAEAYSAFREDRGLLDFTDMLERYAASGAQAGAEVAIVDEAQDLTPLQWRCVERAFGGSAELWVGGDPDQAIHAWAGADGERLLTTPWPREHLARSRRLPRAVFELAASVIGRVGRRFVGAAAPTAREGAVEWVSSAEEVDLSAGTWLLLARTRRQLAPLEAAARAQGVAFSTKGRPSVDTAHVRAIVAYEALRAGRTVGGAEAAAAARAAGVRAPPDDGIERGWSSVFPGRGANALWHDALVRIPLDDREHYLSILRRGGSLTRPPRVRVDTIHGSKGAEAAGVVLVTDLTRRVAEGYEAEPDPEHRVFYVGVTRASEKLVAVAPSGPRAYPL